MARFTLSEPHALRIEQLAAEIAATPACALNATVESIIFFPPLEVEVKNVGDDPDQLAAIQAVVSAHVPQRPFFEEEFDEVQADAVREIVRTYLHGLNRLPVVDFGYAYLGRLIAKADGASEAEILAIVDKATAQAYITGMNEWAALPAATRQWLAVDLESRAYDAMVIRLLLT